MSLKNKINDDLVKAMKAKDTPRIETLRSIRAEILKMDKSGLNREITEDELTQILIKQAKIRKEAIEMFKNAGRDDLVNRESVQLAIINEYLPEQLSEVEAREIAERIIAETGASSMKDLGKVMKIVMAELKGKIDGRLIQEIVRNCLGG